MDAPNDSSVSNAQSVTAVPAHFRRIFRAFVSPQQVGAVELSVFVEAYDRAVATRKICQALAIIESGSTPESIAERIYNCSSAKELIADGCRRRHRGSAHGVGLVRWKADLLRLASARADDRSGATAPRMGEGHQRGDAMKGRLAGVPEWVKVAVALAVYYCVAMWAFFHTWATP